MNKLICTLFCIFSFCGFIKGEESETSEPFGKPTDANIFGHVLDAKTEEHLPFINIAVKNSTIGVLSDATGHFVLKNLPEGTFILVAEGIGYKP
ncbi:MAG: carboxypeptidase-like regulatory domain-containing protein [Candidatus Azobacteroides sp.]|nr:carboxypeptidase-like regulatory domain-containing protein [Candidatus Azobacteroides sp.]